MNVSTQNEVFAWQPANVLRVSGPDALGFLQGQFTNELRGLSNGGAVYGLWLNVKGKVIADSFVIRITDGQFRLVSYCCSNETVRRRLETHIIADDVTLEDETSRSAAITLFGPGATILAASIAAESAESIITFPGRRIPQEHAELVLPRSGLPMLLARLTDARPLEAAEINRRRLAAGIAAVPADIGPADLPNEGGLDVDAISYTKGCYLGQEVMARLKSMGQIRRRLLRVVGRIAAIPPLPAPVFVAARQAGELRSAAIEPDGTLIGLAMVSLLTLGSESDLAFAPDAAPVLRVLDRP